MKKGHTGAMEYLNAAEPEDPVTEALLERLKDLYRDTFMPDYRDELPNY